ncbi:MAG: hypothetical protein KDE25_02890 [Novosphingobium sp.]|nr:hypothetical protein [Novosphingobium sp.]
MDEATEISFWEGGARSAYTLTKSLTSNSLGCFQSMRFSLQNSLRALREAEPGLSLAPPGGKVRET